MAVPQLQLANLGEIYAQNQARQASMDNLMMQQQAMLEQRQAAQAAAQREAAIRQAIASGVDPSSREGLGQLLQAGLPLEQFQSGLKNLGDIELAKQRGLAAQAQADAAKMRGQAAMANVGINAEKARIYARKAAADMGIKAADLRLAQDKANRELGLDQTEQLSNFSRNVLALPEDQQEIAWRNALPTLQAMGFKELPATFKEAKPQVTAFAAFGKPQGKGGTVTLPDGTVIESGGFSNEQKLRKEFLDQSKNFIDVRDSYSRLQAVAADPSPAGDISIIFSYMKMLDPGSVVREGEQATAQNAAGIPDRIRNLYNKAITGERLSPSQRADFVRQGQKLYEQALGQVQKNARMYEDIAQKSGLNPELAVPDIGIAAQPTPAGGGQGGGQKFRFNSQTGDFE
jgi:hypothetical protein